MNFLNGETHFSNGKLFMLCHKPVKNRVNRITVFEALHMFVYGISVRRNLREAEEIMIITSVKHLFNCRVQSIPALVVKVVKFAVFNVIVFKHLLNVVLPLCGKQVLARTDIYELLVYEFCAVDNCIVLLVVNFTARLTVNVNRCRKRAAKRKSSSRSVMCSTLRWTAP